LGTVQRSAQPIRGVASRGSLGPVLTATNQGTITGWDVDETKNYGLLSAGNKNGTQLETFDLSTAKITTLGSFQRGKTNGNVRQFVVLKILANHEAVIDDINFNPNTFARNDTFPTVKPADKAKVTGKWTPANRNGLLIQWVADNQVTTTNAVIAENANRLIGIVSDIEANSFQPNLKFESNQVFQTPDLIAQDTAANVAIVPMQLFIGSFFDPFEPPSFDIFDLATRKLSIFSSKVGSGPVQGIAVDPATHIMCTATGDDSNVEFYDLQKQTGFAVPLPNGGGEGTGGGAIAVDRLNHLFLVTQPAGFLASASVYVYDERGNLQESISGFNFSNRFSALFAYIAVNEKLRIGYTSTANADQLQSFTY
jgi:WD40 repeat protein